MVRDLTQKLAFDYVDPPEKYTNQVECCILSWTQPLIRYIKKWKRYYWTRTISLDTIYGKHGMMLRVITVYCPCVPSQILINSIYTQQQYVASHNDNRCSRQAFCDDISVECCTWIKLGGQIVMMVDLNEGVTSTTRMFQSLGFHETTIDKHKK